MALEQLGLTLVFAVLIASPQTSWCCSNNGGSDRGRNIRVSGHILLSPPPQRLPANARLEVRLKDISLVDAPSKLLTSKTLDSVSAGYTAGGRIPFSLEAAVPEDTPFTNNSVAVSATLVGDGVSFITLTNYYVDLRQGTFDYRDMEITIEKFPLSANWAK